jgi:L-threonylcarbamoyladenylate synthase
LKPVTDIRSLDPDAPDEAVIGQAAEIIRRGELVVFPTHGLYGLGGDPFNPAAVQRIFDLKGRAPDRPLLVLIADMKDLSRVALAPSAVALDLMARFWPGKVTFVLPARKELPAALTGGHGKIGVRLVGHPVAASLVRALAAPLTGTSANISGTGGCATIQQIDIKLIQGVQMVLDAGRLAGGRGSTVVDVTGKRPQILREGAVAAQEILDDSAPEFDI